MAYRKPTKIDDFLNQMAKADIYLKTQLAEDLTTFMTDQGNSINSKNLSLLVDSLMSWLTENHYKIAHRALEAFIELINRLGPDSAKYASLILPHVVDFLDNRCDILREKAQIFIHKLIEFQVIPPQELLEKIVHCFKRNNSEVREDFLQTIVDTLKSFSKLGNTSEVAQGTILCAEHSILAKHDSSSQNEQRPLREFDEQLQSLRRENFNLKLRIFFLEERTTFNQNGNITSSTAATKPLGNIQKDNSKQNIDLQGVNDLKIQLNEHKRIFADKACVIQDLKEKLNAKTRAHERGCRTIQHLLKKIRELDVEMNQLKSKMNFGTGNIINKIDNTLSTQWHYELTKVCGLLAWRLKELAGFLGSLLDNEKVFGILAEKHNEGMRKAVENSLDLSRNMFSNEGQNLFMGNDSVPLNFLLALPDSEARIDQKTRECNRLSLLENITDIKFEDKGPSKMQILQAFDSYEQEHNFVVLNNSAEEIRDSIESLRQINASLVDTNSNLNIKLKILIMKCDGNHRSLTEQIYSNKDFKFHVDRFFKKYMSQGDFYQKIAELLQNETINFEILRAEVFKKLVNKIEKEVTVQYSSIIQQISLRSDLDNLKLQSQEIENCLTERENILHELNDRVNEMKNQNSEQEKVLINLKRSLDETMLERKKLMNERDYLEKHIEDLKDKYDELLTESSELHTKLAKFGHKNAQLHNKLVFNESNIPSNQEIFKTILFGGIPLQSTTGMSGDEHHIDGASRNIDNTNIDNTNTDDMKTDKQLQFLSMNLNNCNDGQNSRHVCILPLSSSSLTANSSNKSTFIDGFGNTNELYKSIHQHSESSFNMESVAVQHNCKEVERENIELKRKLEKTRRAFEKTWTQLRVSNHRKEQIEKDIRQEIFKTHNVLKNVRYNIEKAGSGTILDKTCE